MSKNKDYEGTNGNGEIYNVLKGHNLASRIAKIAPNRIYINIDENGNKYLEYIIPSSKKNSKYSDKCDGDGKTNLKDIEIRDFGKVEIRKKLNFKGKVHGICGPMRSGKSRWLIDQLNMCDQADRKVCAFKPKLDLRTKNITSRTKGYAPFPSKLLEYDDNDNEMPKTYVKILDFIISDGIQVVGIDELQFVENCADLCMILKALNILVFVSFLDGTFNQKQFPNIEGIYSVLDTYEKHSAMCHGCNISTDQLAPFTYKQHSMGEKISSDIIAIGDSDYYAVCGPCLNELLLGNKTMKKKESCF